MSRRAVVLIAPTSSINNLRNPDLRREPRSFHAKLRILASREPPAVRVNHDTSRKVGTVTRVFKLNGWPIGNSSTDWWAADLDLDQAADWVKRGTPVSVSIWPMGTSADGYGDGVEVVHDSIVAEVSVLTPSHQPVEPHARVISVKQEPEPAVQQPTPKPRTRTRTRRDEWERAEIIRRIDAHKAAFGEDVNLSQVFHAAKIEWGYVPSWKM